MRSNRSLVCFIMAIRWSRFQTTSPDNYDIEIATIQSDFVETIPTGSHDSIIPSSRDPAVDIGLPDWISNDTTNSTDAPEVIFWQSTQAALWFKYGSPFLLVIGTVRNLMAAVTLQSPLFHSSSTRFILSALALCDVFVLNTGLMRWWLLYFNGTDIRTISSYGCKIHLLLTYYSHQLASWTLILLTSERTISVTIPLKCKQLWSKKRIVMTWLAIALVLFVFNIHFFFNSDIIEKQEVVGNTTTVTLDCDTLKSWEWFLNGPYTWIDACLGDFIPFLVVITGNVIIVIKLLRAQKARSKNMQVVAKDGKKLTSTTTTLLLISVIFFTFNVPMDIHFIGEGYGLFPLITPEDKAIGDFRFAIVSMFYYGNNAIEFILYFISGSKFRSAFVGMFCCRRPKRPAQFRQRVTNPNSAEVTNSIPVESGWRKDRSTYPTNLRSFSRKLWNLFECIKQLRRRSIGE